VRRLPEGTRLDPAGAVVGGPARSNHRNIIAEYPQEGIQRVRESAGTFPDWRKSPPRSTRNSRMNIDVVVDRIVGASPIRQRLAESVETRSGNSPKAWRMIEYADARLPAADDKKSDKQNAKITTRAGRERILFSEKFACPVSGFTNIA